LPVWVFLVGIFFVCVVLAEVLRLSRFLIKGLQMELRVETSGRFDLPGTPPFVSVIIPAKDEEQNIEQTVRSILDSDYHNFEIVLTDDRSRDNTLDIMEALAREDTRIHVLVLGDLPHNWTGKTHALFKGAEQVSGEILVFSDADASWSRDVLSRSLEIFMSENLDMLSLLPGFTKRGFSEYVVHPHLALGISSFYPLTDVNDQAKSAALASGCFIMITKEYYLEVGTWERFRDEITEDVAMSKAVKTMGGKLKVLRAGNLVRTMPFKSVSAACSFWRRTLYGSLEKSVPKIIRLAVNYISLSFLCVLFVLSLLVLLCVGMVGPELALLAISTLTMAAVMIPFSIFLKGEQVNRLYGLAIPLGLVISAWIALSTVFAILSKKGIEWRGTVYK